jgi:hypothetical protein
VTLEEVAELVAQRVSVEVDEDDVAGWIDADREAIREVAEQSLIALPMTMCGASPSGIPRLER